MAGSVEIPRLRLSRLAAARQRQDDGAQKGPAPRICPPAANTSCKTTLRLLQESSRGRARRRCRDFIAPCLATARNKVPSGDQDQVRRQRVPGLGWSEPLLTMLEPLSVTAEAIVQPHPHDVGRQRVIMSEESVCNRDTGGNGHRLCGEARRAETGMQIFDLTTPIEAESIFEARAHHPASARLRSMDPSLAAAG